MFALFSVSAPRGYIVRTTILHNLTRIATCSPLHCHRKLALSRRPQVYEQTANKYPIAVGRRTDEPIERGSVIAHACRRAVAGRRALSVSTVRVTARGSAFTATIHLISTPPPPRILRPCDNSRKSDNNIADHVYTRTQDQCRGGVAFGLQERAVHKVVWESWAVPSHLLPLFFIPSLSLPPNSPWAGGGLAKSWGAEPPPPSLLTLSPGKENHGVANDHSIRCGMPAHRLKMHGVCKFSPIGTKMSVAIATSFERPRKAGRIDHATYPEDLVTIGPEHSEISSPRNR